MKKEQATFWFFDQNNTGGSFDVDDKVCHRVVIEAGSKKDAVVKASQLGIYYNGVELGVDCGCCGDRWYLPHESQTYPYDYAGFDSTKAEEICERYNAKKRELDEKEKWGDNEYGVIFKDIESHCQYLADTYGWTTPDIRIYYKNGNVKEIFKEEK